MPSFTITKPSWFSSTLELRQGDRIIGELKMIKKFSYALAEAKMPDQLVRFGYNGWTARDVFIQDAQGKDLASVQNLSWWTRAAIVTIDGKKYAWNQKDWWGMRCEWLAPDGKVVMKFQSNWRGKTTIDIESNPNKTEMILLFFGIYQMKLQELDSASSWMWA